MIFRGTRPTYAALTLLILAGLAYVELYPFDFRIPAQDAGPLRALIASWAERPSGGDFLANVLAYVPLGFCASMMLGWPRSRLGRLPIVTLTGAGLSMAFELTQYYIEGRVTAATDVYANTIGVLLGASAAALAGSNSAFVIRLDVSPVRIPLFLIIDWTAYRLYPYVPATDVHKFWQAVKPVLLAPSPHWYDVLRHVAVWLTLFVMVDAVADRRNRSPLLAAVLFSGTLLGARICIVGTTLSMAEVGAAVLALGLWPVLLIVPKRPRAGFASIILSTYILIERLQPFAFQETGREFGWIPFRSLMTGSPEMNVMAVFEKTFLYGGLLYLLDESGCGLRYSAAFLAGTLFATSWLETYLPGRSAETTDAALALLIASAFALVQPRNHASSRVCEAPGS